MTYVDDENLRPSARVAPEASTDDSATVRAAMSSDPATSREDDDVRDVLSLMAARQVRRVPVVGADGRLVGIIAQADVATRLQQDRRTGELVEAISEPPSGRR